MDMDIDLDDDRIKKFLKNKLEEMQAGNHKLEVTLHERRQLLKAKVESFQLNKDDDGTVKIDTEVSKKCFNNKYAIISTIENSHNICLENLRAFLIWDSSYPLEYKIDIYENIANVKLPTTFVCSKENCENVTGTLRKSTIINASACLVIIIDQPKFEDQLEYRINGNLLVQGNDKNITITFPSVKLAATDVSSRDLHDWSTINGPVENLLTVMACSDQTALVMILPEQWNSTLDSTFEIHCSLSKVAVSSGCKTYFIAHRVSPCLDGTLVDIHNHPYQEKTNDIVVYSRNEDCLISLLHHLHQNIPGVVLIPKALHPNYLLHNPKNTSSVDGTLKEFHDSINKEIRFVKNFLRQSESLVNRKEFEAIKFRSDLADLEKMTDNLYFKICRLNF